MSLERLRPTVAAITFDGSASHDKDGRLRNKDSIIGHIQAIHDSSFTPIAHKARRLNVPPETLELRASPHGVMQAAFYANIAVAENDDVQVRLPGPYRLNQRAGLAALHLYGQLTEGRSLVEQINTVEYSSETADRFVRQAMEGFDTLDIEELLNDKPTAPRPTDTFIVSSAMISPNRMGTLMTLDNSAGWTLPEALRHIQTGYDSLYPELGSAATSVAVAGVVGTRSLEAFEDAWESAISHHDPGRPYDASRALLESGAFLLDFDGFDFDGT